MNRTAGLICALALVAASCGGTSSPGPGATSGSGPAGMSGTPESGAAAVPSSSVGPGTRLTVTTADEQAASALIDEGGGGLTATLGSLTFTLAIPADALLSPETITMTPISSIRGSPLEQAPVGGVVFAPDGLLLAAPALLTITGGPPTDDTIGFGFDGSGADFHLVPFLPGDAVVLPVLHFSGLAYGPASLAIVARIVASRDARGIDAITQAATPKMKELQTAYKAGDQERFETILGELQVMAVEAEDFAIDGLRAAAHDPLVLGEAAIMQALSTLRLFQLLNMDPPFDTSLILVLLDKIDAAVDALCAEKATEPGASAKPALSVDPVAIVSLIVSAARQRLMVTGIAPDPEELLARIQACAFMLTVQPTIIWLGVNVAYAGLGPPETHAFDLTGPVTPLTFSKSKAERMPLGVSRYRWTADVRLTVSDFTTNDACWTHAPPIITPGFEPTLHVEMVPDLNIPRPIGSPVKGAAKAPPSMAARVVINLINGFDYAWYPPPQGDKPGPGPVCIGSAGMGIKLSDSWAAVDGGSPERVGFGGGSFSWTRQSPPGTTPGLNGYYRLLTDITFKAVKGEYCGDPLDPHTAKQPVPSCG